MSNIEIETMKYNDLKALAKERGLDATGTKEVLQTRLKEAAGQPATPADESDTPPADTTAPVAAAPATPADEPAPTQTSPVQERALEQTATKALRKGAQEMKDALDKQKKVSIMIPFEAGESPESGKLIPFHVNLNG